jgi:two-component system KDP operon response regulator KdpE
MMLQDSNVRSNRYRVLVVDDEPAITRALRVSFITNGYDVRIAHDGISALNFMDDWKPDIIITDLAMPEMDGIELCKRIRSASTLPIILLSVRDAVEMKIRALDAGADDYVTKPFSIEELLARVRTALRRLELLRSSGAQPTDGELVLEAGDFKVDLLKRHVTIQNREIKLTPKEYDLLLFLLRNADRVLTHAIIIQSIWGPHNTHQTEYLRVLVAALRRKIEPDPLHPQYLITDPWVGYRLTSSGEDESLL